MPTNVHPVLCGAAHPLRRGTGRHDTHDTHGVHEILIARNGLGPSRVGDCWDLGS